MKRSRFILAVPIFIFLFSTNSVISAKEHQGSVDLFSSKKLYMGSKGKDVARLQQILIDKFFLLPIYKTSYFGVLTQKALVKFQKSIKLKATGVFDQKTISAVNSAYDSHNIVEKINPNLTQNVTTSPINNILSPINTIFTTNGTIDDKKTITTNQTSLVPAAQSKSEIINSSNVNPSILISAPQTVNVLIVEKNQSYSGYTGMGGTDVKISSFKISNTGDKDIEIKNINLQLANENGADTVDLKDLYIVTANYQSPKNNFSRNGNISYKIDTDFVVPAHSSSLVDLYTNSFKMGRSTAWWVDVPKFMQLEQITAEEVATKNDASKKGIELALQGIKLSNTGILTVKIDPFTPPSKTIKQNNSISITDDGYEPLVRFQLKAEYEDIEFCRLTIQSQSNHFGFSAQVKLYLIDDNGNAESMTLNSETMINNYGNGQGDFDSCNVKNIAVIPAGHTQVVEIRGRLNIFSSDVQNSSEHEFSIGMNPKKFTLDRPIMAYGLTSGLLLNQTNKNIVIGSGGGETIMGNIMTYK